MDGPTEAGTVLTQALAKSSTSNPPRVEFLDGLRGLACFWVLLCHAYFHFWQVRPSLPPFPGLLLGWMRFGHLAVAIFIVLSGFCLTLPVVRGDGTLRGGAASFFRRRARRILPPYYCTLAVSALLIVWLVHTRDGFIWDGCFPITVTGVFAHIFLLQDYVGNVEELNHSLGTVAVESQIYLVFPLLLLLWRRIGPFATTGFATIVGYAGYELMPERLQVTAIPQFLTLFTFGMLGATLAYSADPHMEDLRRRTSWLRLGIMAAIIAFLFCLVIGSDNIIGAYGVLDFLVGTATVCLLVEAARSEHNFCRSVLSARPVVALGTISYSVYLLHAPLEQVFVQYAGSGHLQGYAGFVELVFVGIPLIIAASYLFYLVCERPFLSASARASSSRKKAQAAPEAITKSKA